MNNKKRKRAARLKILRLLTLLSFFHFSGLNNGFTQVVVVAGKIQSASFAPAVIGAIGSFASPSRWKRSLAGGEWKRVFFRSTRVIEIASRGAIQKILTESDLVKLWMSQSFKTAGGREYLSGNKHASGNEFESGKVAGKNTTYHLPFTSLTAVVHYLKLGEKYLKWDEGWKSKYKFDLCFWAASLYHFKIMVHNLSPVTRCPLQISNRFKEKFKGVGYHQSGDKGEGARFLSIENMKEFFNKIDPAKAVLDGVFFLRMNDRNSLSKNCFFRSCLTRPSDSATGSGLWHYGSAAVSETHEWPQTGAGVEKNNSSTNL